MAQVEGTWSTPPENCNPPPARPLTPRRTPVNSVDGLDRASHNGHHYPHAVSVVLSYVSLPPEASVMSGSGGGVQTDEERRRNVSAVTRTRTTGVGEEWRRI